MNETTKAITIAVAASAAAAVTTAIITHYFTKQATIQNVATGKEPLPAGSTPTTSAPTLAPGATPSTAPGTMLPNPNLPSVAYAPPPPAPPPPAYPSDLQRAIALSDMWHNVPLDKTKTPAPDSP